MGHSRELFASFFLAVAFLAAPPVFAQQFHPAPVQDQASERSWLGITIQEMNEETARSMGMTETGGVLVSDVAQGGPADQAGVRMGDVIVELNGEDVTGADDFISRIGTAGVGSTVALEVNRGGETEDLLVQLGKMPMTATPGRGFMMGGGMTHGMMDCPMGMDGRKGMRGHGRYMKDGMFGRMYGKMTMGMKALDLTPEQSARARDIYTEFRKQAIKTGSEVKIAEIDLYDLLRADPVNMERVRAKIGEINSKKADLMMAGVRGMEEFKKVLTPEQRGRLKNMLAADTGIEDEMGGDMAPSEME